MKLAELQRFSMLERQVMLELLVLVFGKPLEQFVSIPATWDNCTHIVRLPNDFVVRHTMRSEVKRDLSQELPAPVAAVALAAAAAPVVEQALKTPVTRRFWSK